MLNSAKLWTLKSFTIDQNFIYNLFCIIKYAVMFMNIR